MPDGARPPHGKRPRKAVVDKSWTVSEAVPPAEPEGPLTIPDGAKQATLDVGGYPIKLTSLDRVVFPELGLTKRDVLRYYLAVAPVLLPHLRDRPMVMKRYLKGIAGEHHFMKRAPKGRPACVRTCTIDHGNGNIINFPMVGDTGSLLWMVNFGCVDLNPWHGRTVEVNTPDLLTMDLDPGDAPFVRVREAALALRALLDERGMPSIVKTSGSSGIHVAVPLVHGPRQKAVWTCAKALAEELERRHPDLVTAEYKTARRPAGRVLADYNQNRWGATLASVYSLRPVPTATVSAPVTWDELAGGAELEDFRWDGMAERLASVGDLWWPAHQDADGPRWSLG